MKKFLVVSILILFGCGAAKDKKIMATWPGKTEALMINSWGVPTQVFDNGDKGKIVVYDKTTYNIYKQPLRKKSFQFFINKNGIIERYLINYK